MSSSRIPPRLRDSVWLLMFAVAAALAALWFAIIVLALEAFYFVQGHH